MTRILILQWAASDYDSLRANLRLLGAALRGLGHETTALELTSDGWRERLGQELQSGRHELAIGMSGMGSDIVASMGGERKLLWDGVKVPFFDWCCDHPALFPTRHSIGSRFVLNGYVFPDHARYHTRHLNPTGAAFTVPLGIPDRALFPGAPRPLSARNGRILYAKSGGDPRETEARWRKNLPSVRDVLFEATEELLGRTTGDFLPTLQNIAERRGMHLAGDGRLAMALLREVDQHVRMRHAVAVLDAVRDYPVDVYGKGWHHLDFSASRIAHHGPARWDEVIAMMPAYLGVLSTHPLVDESIHDRAFFALAAGSVPISQSNAFSRANLPELERYAFTIERDRVASAVDALLAEPDEAIARTECTYRALEPRYSFREAARQIVEFARLHTMNERLG